MHGLRRLHGLRNLSFLNGLRASSVLLPAFWQVTATPSLGGPEPIFPWGEYKMKKVMLVLPALAVMCLASSVQADQSAIDSATLSAMGLSGVQVVSDAEAKNVRGMGYRYGNYGVKTYGHSYANISTRRGGNLRFETGTEDGFESRGRYLSGGQHASEAYVDYVKTETVDVPGAGSKTTTISRSLTIGAAGSASGYSF